jgi:hypothetical protein
MKKGTGKEKDGRRKLSRTPMRRWLRGQRVMNRFTEAERRAWLKAITVEQAREVFDELNQLGDSWKEHGGDLVALEQRRIESKIEARRLFLRIERKQKRRQ